MALCYIFLNDLPFFEVNITVFTIFTFLWISLHVSANFGVLPVSAGYFLLKGMQENTLCVRFCRTFLKENFGKRRRATD